MNKTWIAAAFAVALTAGAGCGGGAGSGNTTSPNRQTPATPADTQTATGTYRGIDYSLVAPRQVKLGDPVIMEFAAKNKRDTGVSYYSGPTKITRMVVRKNDVAVYDSNLLFKSGDILPNEQLDPQKTLTLPITWNQTTTEGKPVAPGTYSVQVSFVPGEDFLLIAKDYSPSDDGVIKNGLIDSEVFKYGPPPVDVIVTP